MEQGGTDNIAQRLNEVEKAAEVDGLDSGAEEGKQVELTRPIHLIQRQSRRGSRGDSSRL